MNSSKYKQKKSRAEVKRYKNSLGESGGGIDSTYHQNVSMLSGSDDRLEAYNRVTHPESREPIDKRPLRFTIGDWVKENAIEVIITMIIVPLVIWMVSNIIDIREGRAVSEYRIEKLEENISKLSDDMPSKESLELQIENLKEDFNDLNVADLEKRIEDLEEKIEN